MNISRINGNPLQDNEGRTAIGTLSNLNTTNKTSLVEAINEVNTKTPSDDWVTLAQRTAEQNSFDTPVSLEDGLYEIFLIAGGSAPYFSLWSSTIFMRICSIASYGSTNYSTSFQSSYIGGGSTFSLTRYKTSTEDKINIEYPSWAISSSSITLKMRKISN